MGLFVRSLFRTNFVVKRVSVCWVFDEGCFFMLKDLFVVCKLKEKIQILLVLSPKFRIDVGTFFASGRSGNVFNQPNEECILFADESLEVERKLVET